jgi:hypothetical protein
VADEKEDLLVIRNTVINLLQQLVEQGVMSPEQAAQLVETAKQSAEAEAIELRESEEVPEETIRVQYVPEIVKQEIRDEVRNELRAEVTQDVIKHAEANRWGVKDALPGWLNRIKIGGDIRLRAEGIYQDEDNSPFYIDPADTNDEKSIQLLNTQDDSERGRVRMRLNITAQVNDSVEAGIRFSTGNSDEPISTNQSLADNSSPYDVVLDLAYLKYTRTNFDGYDWLTAWGGRMPNPWFHTDTLWDSDLNFAGAAVTARYNFPGSDSLYDLTESNKEMFFTFGAFPLEEYDRSSNDPWLFGAQLGGIYTMENQSRFKAGLAYYYYDGIRNKRAAPGSGSEDDFRAPRTPGIGNTYFEIQDPLSSNVLLGYATDYELLDFTAKVDLMMYAPYRLTLSGNFVENIGYDLDSVAEQVLGSDYDEETTAYQMRVDFGWPSARLPGKWKVFALYKHVERDAVLASFTDSDFHGGGTDAEGYMLGGEYGIAKNTWFRFRWISTDEIDGPEWEGIDCDALNCDFSYDRAQFDLNAKF